MKCFVRENENLFLNETKLDTIVYCYANDKLFNIQYVLKEKVSVDAFKEFVLNSFGLKFQKNKKNEDVMIEFDSNNKIIHSVVFSKFKDNATMLILDHSALK